MKCSDYQRLIYQIDELDKGSHAKLTSHIRSCVACAQVLERMQRDRKVMLKALGSVKIADPAALTNTIMRAVRASDAERKAVRFPFSLGRVQVFRWSMATLSFLLVATFLSEYTHAPDSRPSQLQSSASVALNSASFARQLKSDWGKASGSWTTGFSKCVAECRKHSSNPCVTCISKLKLKLHETI